MTRKLVIDTNVLVASLSSRSVFHWIIKYLLGGFFDVYVTDDIILEYEEVLSRKYSTAVAQNFIAALQELSNVHFVTIHFRWRLLRDPDDNKFVDCFLAAGAEYLVTNDTDFDVLKKVGFPKVEVISILQFEKMIKK